jgi:hypothetical protein
MALFYSLLQIKFCMHHNYHYLIKFLVLTAASLISLCSLTGTDKNFTGTDKNFQRCILHRPLTGQLFIPQVIYEQGEPWWNDIYRIIPICPPELSGNPTSSHLAANRRNWKRK